MTKFEKGEEVGFKGLLHAKLMSAKKVLLTSHKGPDDDSISSVLGLYHYIHSAYVGIEIEIVYASPMTTRWAYFEGYDLIRFGIDPMTMSEFDLVLMTDACQWSRVSQEEALPDSFREKVLAIDHHKNEPEEGIPAYIDNTACSCAELIYRLFYSESEMNTRLAEVLLLGIIGDSGNFTYVSPAQTEIFVIAERLVREGKVDVQTMKATYQQYALATYKLLAFIMSRTVFEEQGKWGKYSLSWISREEALSFTTSEIEIKAAADIYINTYAKSVVGVNWGMLIYPNIAQGNYNLTLRSLPGGVNVRQLAGDLLSGGGHILAAGGKFSSSESIDQAINKIRSFLESTAPVFP